MANRHRHSIAVEGHCQGVSAGYHTLSLYLASCPWGTGYLDVYTGWNSCRNRVIINELRKETNIGAGTHRFVFDLSELVYALCDIVDL